MSLPPGAPSERSRRRFFLLLTMFLILAVPLSAAELFVRIVYRYNSPDSVKRNSLQYVATVFSRHMPKPNQTIEVDEAWGVEPNELPTHRVYRINSLGYRGRPFPARKETGERRIVVLGGSSVFDPAATEGRDWPHLVEEKLRKKGLQGVEVLNAGVPGHATPDMVGRLYSQIWTLEPDYVLVYEAWNDIKYFTDVTNQQPL